MYSNYSSGVMRPAERGPDHFCLAGGQAEMLNPCIADAISERHFILHCFCLTLVLVLSCYDDFKKPSDMGSLHIPDLHGFTIP